MKKKILSIFITLAIIVNILSVMFIVEVNAASNEKPNYSTAVSSYSELQSRLNNLISKYKGTYWTTNGKAANSSGDTSKYYYGIQCNGFAKYIFNDLFCTGSIGSYDSNKYYFPNPSGAKLIDKSWNFSSSDTGTVKSILSRGDIGDFIQVRRRGKSYGHSMILAGKDDGGITIFDCNSDGKCGVKYYYQSYKDFASKNVGMSLYHSTKYPSKNIPPEPDDILPGAIDNNYSVPTTVTVDHKIYTYDTKGKVESNHWIDSGDKCYIEAVYTNGFVKVKYPTSSGQRWSYAKKDDFPQIPLKGHAPTGYSISISSTNMFIGEYVVVTITPKAGEDVTGYKFFALKPNGETITKDMGNNNQAKINPSSPGEYIIYGAVYNNYGEYRGSTTNCSIKLNIKEPIKSTTCKVQPYGDNNGNNIKITWNACENTTGYDVKIYDNKGENVLYNYSNVQGTSYIAKIPPGQYQAGVCSISSKYNYTAKEGNKFSFTAINNLGTNFYAYIINYKSWLHLTNDKDNVSFRKTTGYSSQSWKFVRNDDGTYYITNCYENKALTANEKNSNVLVSEFDKSTGQKWYIYGTPGNYYFRPVCSSDKILDLEGGKFNDGDNARISERNYGDTQKMEISLLNTPGQSTLSTTAGTSVSPTKFKWTATKDTTYYSLAIYKNKIFEGEPVKVFNTLTEKEWDCILSEGKYQACIYSYNNCTYTISNVVTIEVKKVITNSSTISTTNIATNQTTVKTTEKTTNTTATINPSTNIIPGDVNDDKKVNLKDVFKFPQNESGTRQELVIVWKKRKLTVP